MTERKYSVSEIDRMRKATAYMTGWNEHDPCSKQEKPARAEDKLRTYMLNGCSPEEIEQESERVINGILAQRKERDDAVREKWRTCSPHDYTREGRGNFKQCVKCGHSVIDPVK